MLHLRQTYAVHHNWQQRLIQGHIQSGLAQQTKPQKTKPGLFLSMTINAKQQ